MSKFTARQAVHISGWECGTEIELTMVATFTVTKFIPASNDGPAEDLPLILRTFDFSTDAMS